MSPVWNTTRCPPGIIGCARRRPPTPLHNRRRRSARSPTAAGGASAPVGCRGSRRPHNRERRARRNRHRRHRAKARDSPPDIKQCAPRPAAATRPRRKNASATFSPERGAGALPFLAVSSPKHGIVPHVAVAQGDLERPRRRIVAIVAPASASKGRERRSHAVRRRPDAPRPAVPSVRTASLRRSGCFWLMRQLRPHAGVVREAARHGLLEERGDVVGPTRAAQTPQRGRVRERVGAE